MPALSRPSQTVMRVQSVVSVSQYELMVAPLPLITKTALPSGRSAEQDSYGAGLSPPSFTCLPLQPIPSHLRERNSLACSLSIARQCPMWPVPSGLNWILALFPQRFNPSGSFPSPSTRLITHDA